MNEEAQLNSPLTAPGLAIKTTSDPAMKSAAFRYKLAGAIYAKALVATLALPTTYVIPAGSQQGITLYIDAAGTITFEEGVMKLNTEVYNFADFARNNGRSKAIVGFVLVKNGTASTTFTGNTTALDTALLTVYYIDNFGVVGMSSNTFLVY